MSIFTHTNGDGGDSMDVYVTDSGTIEFHTAIHGQYGSSCRVPKEDALRLYAAIGEALYPVHTPEAPNRSLIEQLIEKAVKNQVAAVLPLHLAPMADRWGYVDADGRTCRGGCDFNAPHVKYGSSCGAPRPDEPAYCRIDGCTFPSTPGAVHFEHDPEPHDVGHPGPVDGDITPDSATGSKAQAMAKWEAELQRDATHGDYCAPCGHAWRAHWSAQGCTATLGKGHCECKRTRAKGMS